MNGKGDKYRVKLSKEFELNYERIFNAKKSKETKKKENSN